MKPNILLTGTNMKGTNSALLSQSVWRILKEALTAGRPWDRFVGTFLGTDSIRQRIKCFRCKRNGRLL